MSAKQSTHPIAAQNAAVENKTSEETSQSLDALIGDFETERVINGTRLAYHLPTSGFKFRAQISSLIELASLAYSKFEDFENFYLLLKDHLLRIPSSEPLTLEASRHQLHNCGIRVPLSDPINSESRIGFIAPDEIDIIGSWSLKNAISSKRKNQHATIDILVRIPMAVLQPNDYLNNRYFHKRAHYLAHIAKSFSNSAFWEQYDFAYSYLEGDSYKPIIIIQPSQVRNSSPKWTARLILSYPPSLFPISRLAPSKANLTPYKNPSPHYNQSVLMDSNELQLGFHSFFNMISTKFSAFNPTCQLIKLWAQGRIFYRQSKTDNQPQSLFGFGRFGWLINFCVANVLLGTEQGSQKHLGASILHSDPAALFKKVIDWLASWKLDSKIIMQTIDSSQRFLDAEFDVFNSSLIDPTGLINLTAGIPLGTLKLLCASAARTRSLLQSSNDVFAVVFPWVSCSFASSFDYHFVIRISDEDIRRLCQEKACKTILSALHVLSENLQFALGDRVTGFGLLCQFLHTSLKLDEACSNGPFELSDSIILRVGLALDSTRAFNLNSKGPSPELPSAELDAFCKFWGPRSQLHRSQDGSIMQSVSWQVNHPLERMGIVRQIMRWLMIEKLGFKDDLSIVWDLINDFDRFIFENPNQVSEIYKKNPMTMGFSNVMTVFNEFAKQLKLLKEKKLIPLLITLVLPVSEYLRYSSVFIPGPRRLDKYQDQASTTKYLPSICCQLRFESSGHWPEDLEAIQVVKAALLCEIGNGLRIDGQILDCKLRYDYNALPIAHNVSLDVLHSSGYAFTLMICYEREEMLLEEASTVDKQDRRPKLEYKSTWALEALSHYRRTFVESRKHHEGIIALQARFPSFTYTVRLIKRWFSTHMLLSTHISIELVELLASVVYLLPDAELPPTTGISGFLRFLKFLKFWDWRREPLLLPLHTSIGLSSDCLTPFPSDLFKSACENFSLMRKKDPGFYQVTYFVATEDDLSGARWMISSSSTRGHDKKKKNQRLWRPNRLISDHIQTLASASIKVLESALKYGSIDFQSTKIFKSPLNHYDFHLILDLSCSTRLHQSFDEFDLSSKLTPSSDYVLSSDSEIESLDLSRDHADTHFHPEIDYDPIMAFVKELQLIYGDSIEFFYDQFGGPLIGGVVNKSLAEINQSGNTSGFKTKQIDYLTKPIMDEHESAINKKSSSSTDPNNEKKINGIGNGRKKLVFDLDGALFDIFVGIGSGLVVKIIKKGIDY